MNALVYFSSFGDSYGGSEYLPLLFVAELQQTCEVTLALNWPSDVERAARHYEVDIDFSRLRVVALKPKRPFLCKLDAVIPFFTVHRLKELARSADVCISCANMIDFGRPAHHFVYLMRLFGDTAFNDYFLHRPPLRGGAGVRRKLRTLAAEMVLRPLLGVRSARKMLSDSRERFYANSEYVARTMRAFYGDFTNHTFYPPTVFEPGAALGRVARDPLRVVYIGRLIPEKRVLEALEIVAQARRLSGADLRFSVAGPFTDAAYAARLKAFAAANDWVDFVGEVYRESKAEFLCSGTYAVHTRLDEEFGIAVAEYLKCGVIPLAPQEGGSPEVVDNPALTYNDPDSAARILARLIAESGFREEMRAHCLRRAQVFSREAYQKAQTEILCQIVADSRPTNMEAACGK